MKRKPLWHYRQESRAMQPEDFDKRPKMVRITKVVNGEKQTVSLSADTAAELGFHSPFDGSPFPLSELLETLFGENNQLDAALPDSDATCLGCGLDFDSFKQTGRLGCGECYETFKVQLDWIMEELHGASRHVGGTPESNKQLARSTSEEEQLYTELNEAIAEENYERAAEIRDRINELQTQSSRSTTESPANSTQ